MITTTAAVSNQAHQSSRLADLLLQAIESAGFSPNGPADHRVAEHGEPVWVCNARAELAAFYASSGAQ